MGILHSGRYFAIPNTRVTLYTDCILIPRCPADIRWRLVMHLYEKNAETLAVCHTGSAEKIHIVSTLTQKKQPSRFWLLLKQSYQGCQLPLRATQSCLSAAHIISWPLFFLRPATCCCTGQMIMIRWYTKKMFFGNSLTVWPVCLVAKRFFHLISTLTLWSSSHD